MEYAALLGISRLLSVMPWSLILGSARLLASFAFRVLRIRRGVTLENLAKAFCVDPKHRWVHRTAAACYSAFGMTFLEFAVGRWRRPEELQGRVRIRGRHNALKAAKGRKGIVYLTAHLGSWELLGSAMGKLDRPLSVLAAEQHNPLVDRFATVVRERLGMRTIPMQTALRGVLRVLSTDGRVGIVADQDAGPNGVFVLFFGRPASVALGPARFAVQGGAPIVIGFDRRLPSGTHEAILFHPLEARAEKPRQEESVRLLAIYTRLLEAFVRKYPEQWFWTHRRWKTPPPASGGVAHAHARSASRSTRGQGG